jgi:putative transposase
LGEFFDQKDSPTTGQQGQEIRHMSSSTFALHLATDRTLDQIVREGARRMLQQALEQEVEDYLQEHLHHRDEQGHRLVVRNGHKPERTILSGSGPLEVTPPRINDKRVDAQGRRFQFTSQILPPYLRKSKNIEELIPWLYLRGISSSAFGDALGALGFDGSGLSASSVGRMKQLWQEQWQDWSRRSLVGKQYVYLWADGIYFNLRLEEAPANRVCVLVVMGATEGGQKELIAVQDGYRESKDSWSFLLTDLKERGLTEAPRLATGDGALGFWQALAEVYPQTRPQRCWVHKTANVLDKLPKGLQPAAKSLLHEIYLSARQEDALKAFERFLKTYQSKYPKAAECLLKDKQELMAFYDFPAEHWQHLRTSNPIESTFAGVRLRTEKTKGSGTRSACLSMVFKLCELAEKHWRKLNGSELLPDVIRGVLFVDGIRKAA